MEPQPSITDHRKRRRRRAEQPPISATLILSDGLKGDVARISSDLYKELFLDYLAHVQSDPQEIKTPHIAIAPWAPSLPGLANDEKWTILPVTAHTTDEEDVSNFPPASVKVSTSSSGLQHFSKAFKGLPSTRGTTRGHSGIEIRVLDVIPLGLDTIFVTVDANALINHDEVQRKFGGGFDYSNANGHSKGKGNSKATQKNGATQVKPALDDQRERLISVTRKALAAVAIIRQGASLLLPFPTHPITHVPFPPAKISFCEPCSQGVVCTNTKVFVNQSSSEYHGGRGLPALNSRNFLNSSIMEEDETSNEQFFSALEDRSTAIHTYAETEVVHANSDTSGKDSGSQSDDSSDNIISIDPPRLASDQSDIHGSTIAYTPKSLSLRPSGFSTPGSVTSNRTARTAQKGSRRDGKLFQTKFLLGKIPDDVIHPRPFHDEDEEGRVFVSIKMLLKLGCFSGDWVRVENTVASANQEGYREAEECTSENRIRSNFRVLKVYGLPEFLQNMKDPHSNGSATRQPPSAYKSQLQNLSTPDAWFSPILLANLGQPSFVRLYPLSAVSPAIAQDGISFAHGAGDVKILRSSLPPIAKEVTLLGISTPLVTERALQKGLHTALQKHFESKHRILQEGDLVPVVIDIGISRLFGHSSNACDADQEVEEFLSFSYGKARKTASFGVAWFKVKVIVESKDDKSRPHDSLGIWGNSVYVETSVTRMIQAQGNEQCKLPSSLDNPWEWYLGIKLPKQVYSLSNIISSAPKPHVSLLRRRLRELIAAGTSVQAKDFALKPIVILLHSSKRGAGKMNTASRASSDLGNHVFPINVYELLSEGGSGGGDYKTEEIFKNLAERALSCGPEFTTILIHHIEAITADRMISALQTVIKNARIIIATTNELDKVAENIRGIFTHEIEVEAPNEQDRESILSEIVMDRYIKLAYDVDLSVIAMKTAALVAGDLVDIVERAVVARQARLELIIKRFSENENSTNFLLRDLLIAGGENVCCVTKADLEIAVDAARKNFADSIGAPKIPNVSWNDVGGLENVKDTIMETIQLPLERPELFAKGMRKRSGILLYGPPGTGKTLLAKAIATEFSLNFFSVKGPELLNMYIGESEANVRKVFQKARDARPCVVFFDELDSVAPKRGNQGDSGGVMDRIVSQLLAELDGMSEGENGGGGGGGGGVFVIGATNRPDLLDQALLRPGRFDKMLYLGVSDTHEKQLTILKALTRSFNMNPGLSLRRVADSLPFTYTGADLYALCSDAMLKAVIRQASAVNAKIKAIPGEPVTIAYFFDHIANKDDITVAVTEKDFFAAQRELVGSVSAKELEHYKHVRRTFEGINVPTKSNMPDPNSEVVGPNAQKSGLPQSILTARPKYKSRSGTAKPISKGKGKGKATRWDSNGNFDDEDDADEDEAYETSNDFVGTTGQDEGDVDRKDSEMGFRDSVEDDEDDLYSR